MTTEVRLAASLTLLCHAATRAMRLGAFPALDEDVDEGGLTKAAARRLEAATWLTSPAVAARRTAEALNVSARVDDALRDIDHGAWAGSSFAELQAADPAGFAAWLADPARGAPGGESLEGVRLRMASWLPLQAQNGAAVVAVTHPMVIRAALAESLDMPLHAALRIDIAPLSRVTLSFNRVWRLQSIQP
jgi:broad specificity phosphatase PhoE